MTECVTLQATLRGKHGQASCTIKATRTHLPRAGIEPQIVDATLLRLLPLPEGRLRTFGGREIPPRVRLENGHLLSRGF